MRSSRRKFLRLATVGATAALAGCGGSSASPEPNERPPETVGTDWSPPRDEWRFEHGDPRNTARSELSTTDPPNNAWMLNAVQTGEVVAATDSTVFVIRKDAAKPDVTAYAAADGSRRWRREFDGDGLRTGGVVENQLALTVGGEDVVALDTMDGTIVWRTPLADQTQEAVPSQFLPERMPKASTRIRFRLRRQSTSSPDTDCTASTLLTEANGGGSR